MQNERNHAHSKTVLNSMEIYFRKILERRLVKAHFEFILVEGPEDTWIIQKYQETMFRVESNIQQFNDLQENAKELRKVKELLDEEYNR